MARFFFFTCLAEIETPSAATKNFGPTIQTANSPRFRPSQFLNTSGTTASAIAVCSGQICVQETDDPNKVNIVLKPHYQPPTSLPEVAYIVYRGIARSSLLSGAGLQTISNCDFINRAITAHENENGVGTQPDMTKSKAILGLSLNVSTDGFSNDDLLDHLFQYRATSGVTHYQISQPPYVKSGEKIGEFSGEAGIEIILNRLAKPLTLSHVREVDRQLVHDDPGPSFKALHGRQDCLSHLDPCAFFTSFFNRKLYYWETTSDIGLGIVQKVDDINEVSVIASRFPYPDRVYFDFRNDYGYSLNLFGTYPDNEPLVFEHGGTQFDLPRDWHGWPLHVLTFADISAAGETKGDYFYTTLKMSTPNHTDPLIYLSRAFVNKGRKLWPHKKAVKGNETRLSLPLQAPSTLLGGYYKINFYDMKRAYNPGTSGWDSMAYAPFKDSPYNGLFRPKDMVRSLGSTHRDISIHIWNEELLVNLTDRGGPCYIAKIGAAEDDQLVTIFAVPEFFVTDAFRQKQAPAFQSWLSAAENVLEENGHKPTAMKYLFNRTAFQEIKALELESGDDPLDRLMVAEDANHGNTEGIFRVNGRFEHCIFFTFAKGSTSEIGAIENQLAGFPQTQAPVFWSEDIPASGPTVLTNDAGNLDFYERIFSPKVWEAIPMTSGAPNVTRAISPQFKVYEVANS